MLLIKDRSTRAAWKLGPCALLLAALFLLPAPALTKLQASGAGNPSLPDFPDFVQQVQNGDANVLRGVYVPDVLALPVSQQPEGDPNYVSRNDGEATQFSTAAHWGTVGLLAHNNRSGRSFSDLAEGQGVRLVYGDGKIEYFVVAEILRFEALQPKSEWSEFRDLLSGELFSAGQVFDRVYGGDRHVTFQTCIRAYGNWNWGRLFVLATPVHSYGVRLRPHG